MLFRLTYEDVENIIRGLDDLDDPYWDDAKDLCEWLRLIHSDWVRHAKNDEIWDSLNETKKRMS